MTSTMQMFRRMRQDRVTAWLLAALIAYMLLLQGAVSAFARTSMAVQELGPTFIICAPSGEHYAQDDHPLADLAPECCSSLCQIACSGGPASVPDINGLAETPDESEGVRPAVTADPVAPSDLGLAGEARAPPALSA